MLTNGGGRRPHGPFNVRARGRGGEDVASDVVAVTWANDAMERGRRGALALQGEGVGTFQVDVEGMTMKGDGDDLAVGETDV